MCDRVAIMSHGAVIASGSVAELLAAGSSGDVRVGLADVAAGADVLRGNGFVVSEVDGALRVGGAGDPARITRLLSEAGLYLTELTPLGADLESVFLGLTSDAPGTPAAGTEVAA